MAALAVQALQPRPGGLLIEAMRSNQVDEKLNFELVTAIPATVGIASSMPVDDEDQTAKNDDQTEIPMFQQEQKSGH